MFQSSILISISSRAGFLITENNCITGSDNKRDRVTLEGIIVRRVRPGTLILTDGWAAYRKLDRLGSSLLYIVYYKMYIVNYILCSVNCNFYIV